MGGGGGGGVGGVKAVNGPWEGSNGKVCSWDGGGLGWGRAGGGAGWEGVGF